MNPGSVQQPRVPFIVAANGPRLMRLAARRGDGWVTTGTSPPEDGLNAWWAGVRELGGRLDDVLADAGRDPSALDRYLSLDSSGTVALTSLDYFEDCLGKAGDLGFTDVVVHWPRADGIYAASESVLDEVAERLLNQ